MHILRIPIMCVYLQYKERETVSQSSSLKYWLTPILCRPQDVILYTCIQQVFDLLEIELYYNIPFLFCVPFCYLVNWFSFIHVLKIAAYLLHRSNLTSIRLLSRYYSNIGYISTYKLVISYETVIVELYGWDERRPTLVVII